LFIFYEKVQVCIGSTWSALIHSILNHKLRRDNTKLMCARSAQCLQGVCERVLFDTESSSKIVESVGRRNLSQFRIDQREKYDLEGLLQGVHNHCSRVKIEESCLQGVHDEVF
jgi:hypothetical protein